MQVATIPRHSSITSLLTYRYFRPHYARNTVFKEVFTSLLFRYVNPALLWQHIIYVSFIVILFLKNNVLSNRATDAFAYLEVVFETIQITWIHRSARTHATIQHFCQQNVEENQRSVYFVQVRMMSYLYFCCCWF